MKERDNISRLEIFCDDRNVMPIKRMLLGIKGVYEIKDTPVINIAPKPGGGVRAKTSGNVIDMFADYLRSNKITAVKAPVVREFQKSVGRAPSGYNWVIKQAINAGLLIKDKGTSGSGSTYTVKEK